MAGVGTPPIQKKASTLPSTRALTASTTPRLTRVTSVAGSRPEATITRSAIDSVDEPADPTDTRLPFMSATDAMPLALDATTCSTLGYNTARVAIGCGPTSV